MLSKMKEQDLEMLKEADTHLRKADEYLDTAKLAQEVGNDWLYKYYIGKTEYHAGKAKQIQEVLKERLKATQLLLEMLK